MNILVCHVHQLLLSFGMNVRVWLAADMLAAEQENFENERKSFRQTNFIV